MKMMCFQPHRLSFLVSADWRGIILYLDKLHLVFSAQLENKDYDFF